VLAEPVEHQLWLSAPMLAGVPACGRNGDQTQTLEETPRELSVNRNGPALFDL
jgi:hypothetical protein